MFYFLVIMWIATGLGIIATGLATWKMVKMISDIQEALIMFAKAMATLNENLEHIHNHVIELNQDAGDIKRRLTWSKKRENKDLKLDKKVVVKKKGSR